MKQNKFRQMFLWLLIVSGNAIMVSVQLCSLDVLLDPFYDMRVMCGSCGQELIIIINTLAEHPSRAAFCNHNFRSTVGPVM